MAAATAAASRGMLLNNRQRSSCRSGRHNTAVSARRPYAAGMPFPGRTYSSNAPTVDDRGRPENGSRDECGAISRPNAGEASRQVARRRRGAVRDSTRSRIRQRETAVVKQRAPVLPPDHTRLEKQRSSACSGGASIAQRAVSRFASAPCKACRLRLGGTLGRALDTATTLGTSDSRGCVERVAHR